jgi:transposase
VTALPPEQLVFVDECGTTIRLTPLYARAPRGDRARDQAPRNHRQNTTLLAALTSHAGISAAMLIEGAADRVVFDLFVEQILVPTLIPGQVVIWDNLSVHKSQRARERIEACGCAVLFLPAYSPDFNPIEQAFSKIKTAVRRAKQRERDGLWEAIGAALASVTTTDTHGWFQHCGYAT